LREHLDPIEVASGTRPATSPATPLAAGSVSPTFPQSSSSRATSSPRSLRSARPHSWRSAAR